MDAIEQAQVHKLKFAEPRKIKNKNDKKKRKKNNKD